MLNFFKDADDVLDVADIDSLSHKIRTSRSVPTWLPDRAFPSVRHNQTVFSATRPIHPVTIRSPMKQTVRSSGTYAPIAFSGAFAI